MEPCSGKTTDCSGYETIHADAWEFEYLWKLQEDDALGQAVSETPACLPKMRHMLQHAHVAMGAVCQYGLGHSHCRPNSYVATGIFSFNILAYI